MMEAFAEALDGGALVGGADGEPLGELAASATEAAIEKLSSALAAVEARERAAAAARAAEAASDDLSRKVAAAAAAGAGPNGAGTNAARGGSAEADVRSAELADALATARKRAEEAREAAAALAAAVAEVSRARGALDDESASEATGARAGRAMRAAGSDFATRRPRAGRRRRRRARRFYASPRRRRRTRTASSLTRRRSWIPARSPRRRRRSGRGGGTQRHFFSHRGVEREANARHLRSEGGDHVGGRGDVVRGTFVVVSEVGFVFVFVRGRVDEEEKLRVAERGGDWQDDQTRAPSRGGAVAGALLPEDLRAARVACGLAAWIYYLPTAHRSLPRFGLRMLVSSLNRRQRQTTPTRTRSSSASPSNASSSTNPNPSNAGDAEQERAAARRAMAAADAAIEELTRASSLSERGAVGGSIEAAREAARLAEAVARQLEAMRDDAGDATDDRSDTGAREEIAAAGSDGANPSFSSPSSAADAGSGSDSTNNVVAGRLGERIVHEFERFLFFLHASRELLRGV